MAMRFEVLKLKDQRYILKVNGEQVFDSPMLSDIMAKIEAYLKLRYLPEGAGKKQGFFMGFLQNIANNQSN